jgi:DNA helicase TIP49 (TBP-interacting protein)
MLHFLKSRCKKTNNKAFYFLKQMTKDFKDSDIKIQSYFLTACSFKITREHDLANDQIIKEKKLLAIEQGNITKEKLINKSLTLNKFNKNNSATQILIANEETEKTRLDIKDTTKISLKDKADIELCLALYAQKKSSSY